MPRPLVFARARVSCLVAVAAMHAVAAQAAAQEARAAGQFAGATLGGAPIVTSPDTGGREVAAGSPVTVVFRIASTSDRRATYRAITDLPQGWRLLSGVGSLMLDPRARETRLVLAAIPALARSGLHQIELRLTDDRDTSRVLARGSAYLRVASRPRVEIVVLDAPEYAAAKDRYHATFLVRNSGNAAVAVRARARGNPVFAVKLDTITFLRAGETRTIRANVTTGAISQSFVVHRLELAVDVAGADTAAATAKTHVLVVARATDDRTGVHQLPLQVRLLGGSRPGGTAAGAMEISGGGPLFDGGSTRIDLLARRTRRAPGMSVAPLPFGVRDEYTLGLWSKGYDMRVGAQSFTLSPLSRDGRFDSGVSAKVRAHGLTVGGFRSDDRWNATGRVANAEQRDAELAGFVEYAPARAFALGVNHLSVADSAHGQLWTVRARLDAHRLARLDAEVGSGTASGRVRAPRGSSMRASGDSRIISYDVQHQQSDTGFIGTHSGINDSYARIALRPLRRLQLSAAARNRRDQLVGAMDSTRALTASRQQDAEVAVPGLLALGYRSLERGYGIAGATARQQSLRVRLHSRLAGITLEGNAERGVMYDKSGARHPMATAMLRSAIRGAFVQTLSVSVERATGRPWFAAYDQDRWSGGINTTVRGRHGFSLDVFATGVHETTPAGARMFSTVDAAVRYASRRGHVAALRSRVVSAGESATRRETQLSLTTPLGIPVRQARHAGRVVGRVYDVETGRGVPDALVRLGDQVVLTDAQGRLAFPAVRPDTYHVQLDLGASRGDRVVFPGASVVSALGGKTTRIEIGVGRGARVAGRVRRYAPDNLASWNGDATALADAGGISGIVVAVSNGQQTFRRVTDADGNFTISDLPPGRWLVSVAGGELPPQHFVATDLAGFVAVTGTTAAVDIRVLPVKRTLRIVSQGAVIATPVQPQPSTPPKGRAP